MQVNRHLSDPAMDHIDHAIGRPVHPLRETYRNRFVVDHDSPEAAAFRVSDHWREGMTFEGMTCFHVTDTGRRALHNHLRQIADKSHSEARYKVIGWVGENSASGPLGKA